MPDAHALACFAKRLGWTALLPFVAAPAALAFLMAGVPGVLAMLLAVPAALLAGRSVGAAGAPAGQSVGAGSSRLATRAQVVEALDRALLLAPRTGRSTAVLVIEIDRFRLLEERHDHATLERILHTTAERLVLAISGDDVFARLDGPGFAVALAPSRRLDLETALQIAGRIQRILGEPVPLGGASVLLSVSVGLSLPGRLRAPTGESLLRAAHLALIEAQRSGPGAIRSYSEAMRARIESRDILAEEVSAAIERGEVMGFFQPQISTCTGAITGFETLARWHHPSRGLIPPSEFLPAVEQAGLMGRLGDAMLTGALRALRDWEAAGIRIPSVGVNLSSAELCDPRLVDRIGWELDRYEITPDRLVIEVLETVVATRSDDVVIRNLAGLARLGCCLDLDDFGTGHASITSIRRFSIERIKIDRSFISRIDEDPEQQKMVAAILTMAERLGLDTLAEGVESAEEQAMLARLGCGHVQGFAIARPMPFAETIPWIRAWEERGGASATAQRQLRAVRGTSASPASPPHGRALPCPATGSADRAGG